MDARGQVVADLLQPWRRTRPLRDAVHRTIVSWLATARINADPAQLAAALQPLDEDELGPVEVCG